MKKTIMRKYIIRSLLILGFIAANHVFDGGPFDLFMKVGPASAQQNTLGQTTLSAAVAGQYLGPGSTGNVPAPTLIQVASATNIIGISPTLGITAAASSSSTNLFIDREQMRVTAVNGTALTVVRGVNGTVATPHASGAIVLFGPARFFYVQDPGGLGSPGGTGFVSNVPCILNNVVVTPWVNIRSGAQWLCSSITLTWVPGFNNGGAPIAAVVTAAVASATTIVPTGPLFHITGTVSMVNITTPVGCNATAVGGCQFTVICDGVCTWTAAGNIAVAAGTVVAGTSITFTWDAKNSKWVPNTTV